MTRFRASAGFTDSWHHFDFDITDGVARITLARPEKLGALTFDAYADLRDLLAERAGVLGVHPTSVDEPEPGAVPLAQQLLAVPCHAGGLVDDGRATLGQAVDQRRLADIREADDGHGAKQPLDALVAALDSATEA